MEGQREWVSAGPSAHLSLAERRRMAEFGLALDFRGKELLPTDRQLIDDPQSEVKDDWWINRCVLVSEDIK